MNIVIEGPEGSGKSTLVAALGECVPNCIVARHPGSTLMGSKLRQIVKFDKDVKLSAYTEQIVLAVDLCDFIEKILIPNVNAGKIVISDRSNLVSGMIYGLAGGVEYSKIELFHKLALVLNPPKMHLVILDASHDDLLARRRGRADSNDKFEMMNSSFHKDVCMCYSLLVNGIGNHFWSAFMLQRCRSFVMPGDNNGLSIYRVDATLSFDKVLEKVLGIISKVQQLEDGVVKLKQHIIDELIKTGITTTYLMVNKIEDEPIKKEADDA